MDLCISMGCTLSELGRRMSTAEFQMWVHRWHLHGFGERRADLRSGIQSATVANYAGRMRDEKAPAAVPMDYMPFMEREPEKAVEVDPLEHFRSL